MGSMLRAVTFRLLVLVACGSLPGCDARAQPTDKEAARPAARAASASTTARPARSAPAPRSGREAAQQAVPSAPDPLELRLQNAERELKALREATQQNAAVLAQMRAEQGQGRSNSRQTAIAMLVALAVFLAGLLGWLAWRWRSEERIARVGRWFAANSELAEPVLPIVDAAAARRRTPMPPVPAPVAAPAAPIASPAAKPIPKAVTAPPERPIAELQASRGTRRLVRVEELIDVHDKADFFLSIGEHEQAIGVLEAHVHDQVETSALAWMDLLELYHRFGKRPEFDRLRAEFHGRFAARAPDFEHFDQPAVSLEQYDGALGRIVAQWPSRKVLDVIEESMFRGADLPDAEPFSLEAYRDLVLLYHIAQDMAPAAKASERSAASPGNGRDSSPQPAAALEDRHPQLDPLLIPLSSPRLGVDIDLEEGPTLPAASMATLDFDLGADAFDAPADPTQAG
jgi:hypothetical protein